MKFDTVRDVEDLQKLEQQFLSRDDGSQVIWISDVEFEVWRDGKRRKIVKALEIAGGKGKQREVK